MVMGIAAKCAREDKKPETAVGSSETKVLPSTFCTITVKYRNPRASSNDCITALSKKLLASLTSSTWRILRSSSLPIL
jgi:hypothetical protein